MTSIEDTLADREKTHGNFGCVSEMAQSLKNVIRRKSHDLTPDQQEALDLLATKIARILCGGDINIDSWLDIEGYARLIRQRIEKDVN